MSLISFVEIQAIDSPSGMLGVVEMSKHVGFDVKRIYFITDVPKHHCRGAHAHKQLRQCFICLRGSVEIEITTEERSLQVQMTRPTQAMILQAGCWRDLKSFSSDALLLVLASEEYDESDYIRDYGEFRNWELERSQCRSVKYFDHGRIDVEKGFRIRRSIDSVIKSGILVGGEAVTTFESRFASFCGVTAGIGVANGLQAITLALRAFDIGPDDEVILPAHTFIATALAVSEVGAKPILIDVEYETGLLDVRKLEAAISSKTRAIIPVHLYGHPVDMDPVMTIAQKHNLTVIEDAAQAHGAEYKGRRCGALGHAAAFSFYPTKNLGALGDAGGLVTDDGSVAARVRQLANYGTSKKYVHEILGTNSRLDPIQAAALGVKLEDLDADNERRRVLANRYIEGLSGHQGINLPAVRPWAKPVWHVFPIRIPMRRDEIERALTEAGIGTNCHYPIPIHLQPCYDGWWQRGDYPIAEKLANELLSLPLQPEHTNVEIDYVINTLKRFI